VLHASGGRLRAVWRLGLYVPAIAAALIIAENAAAQLAPMRFLPGSAESLIVSAWLMLLAAVAVHVLMLRLVERRPWRDVGLGPHDARPGVLGAGALVGAVAVGLPTLALLAAGWFRVDAAPAAGAGGWVRAAVAMLAMMAPAALFEELVFRGYPFLVLRESTGPGAALVLTSLLFGIVHAQNPGATPGALAIVALAGLFLGGVLLATGSLWAAWTAHLAWNWTLGALLHTEVSGLPFATPGYRMIETGPDWLTGGMWGPEGGAGAAAGMLGALGLLVAWRRRRAGAGSAASFNPFARPEGRGSL
jgi:hypothetical protein